MMLAEGFTLLKKTEPVVFDQSSIKLLGYEMNTYCNGAVNHNYAGIGIMDHFEILPRTCVRFTREVALAQTGTTTMGIRGPLPDSFIIGYTFKLVRNTTRIAYDLMIGLDQIDSVYSGYPAEPSAKENLFFELRFSATADTSGQLVHSPSTSIVVQALPELKADTVQHIECHIEAAAQRIRLYLDGVLILDSPKSLAANLIQDGVKLRATYDASNSAASTDTGNYIEVGDLYMIDCTDGVAPFDTAGPGARVAETKPITDVYTDFTHPANFASNAAVLQRTMEDDPQYANEEMTGIPGARDEFTFEAPDGAVKIMGGVIKGGFGSMTGKVLGGFMMNGVQLGESFELTPTMTPKPFASQAFGEIAIADIPTTTFGYSYVGDAPPARAENLK